MSTRGIYGFRKNNENKITYNHSDSYPTWLGEKIVEFCAGMTDQDLENLFDHTIMVDELEKDPTKIEMVRKFTKKHGNNPGESKDVYFMLHFMQGNFEEYRNIAYLLEDFPMTDARDFFGDGLFCEWGYIINLDDKCLDVYRDGDHKIRSFALSEIRKDPKKAKQKMNSLEEELDKEEEEELKEDLCEKMIDILERHNISYYPEDADLGDPHGDIMLEFWTDTTNQDVVIELSDVNGFEDFFDKLSRWLDNYDVTEEFDIYWPLHGTRGVPDSPYTLLEDFEEVQETVGNLIDDMKKLENSSY